MSLSSGERIAEIDVLQTTQIQAVISADGKRNGRSGNRTSLGNAEAKALLMKIAAGEATHPLTKDAAASLKRLQR